MGWTFPKLLNVPHSFALLLIVYIGNADSWRVVFRRTKKQDFASINSINSLDSIVVPLNLTMGGESIWNHSFFHHRKINLNDPYIRYVLFIRSDFDDEWFWIEYHRPFLSVKFLKKKWLQITSWRSKLAWTANFGRIS